MTDSTIRPWYELPKARRLLIAIAREAGPVIATRSSSDWCGGYKREALSPLVHDLDAFWQDQFDMLDGTPLQCTLSFSPWLAAAAVHTGRGILGEPAEIPEYLLAIWREFGVRPALLELECAA